MKRKLKRSDLILSRRIPKDTDTKKVAMLEYGRYCALIPVDYLYDGRYKLEFIKQTGVPLPNDIDVSRGVDEMFCHNLCDILAVNL